MPTSSLQMEFKIYDPSLATDWDAFVENHSLNGTMLHTRKFYRHNPKNEAGDNSFVFLKKRKIVALLPAVIYEKEGKKILHSHLRATYGGFIVSPEIGVAETVELVQHVVDYSRQNGISELIVRNPFRIFNRRLADESDYAMWYHGFSVKSREIETAIPLNEYDEVRRNYCDSTERSVKKSQKHLTVSTSVDYRQYWDMLEQNLATKYDTKPTHSYKEFMDLLDCVGSDKVKLFVAETGGRIAGGIVVFITNEIALHAQYIASDEEYQEYRPLNAVIDFIVKWGCENGYRYFNLGTSNTDGGREINSGLFRFKEGFGGRGVLRETMHLLL